MSVLWCRESVEDRNGTSTVLTLPSGGTRIKNEYTRQYKVKVDNKFDDAATVAAQAQALGLPVLFDSHPSDPFALLQSVEPRISSESPYLWLLNLKYSNDCGDPAKSENSPL